MAEEMYDQSGGGRTPSTSLVYDAKTGKWTSVSANSKGGSNTNSTTKASADSSAGQPSTASKVDSKTAAEKKYIDIEFNTLVGELSLTSTEKSIRIQVNDTIEILGIGKYLSGLYYVSGVRRSLNKDTGYTHTFTVIKNGFGSSLKKPQAETRKQEVTKSGTDFNTGDSVKIVGDNAVYSNAHDGVKVPKWVKEKTLTVDAVSNDGTRVRLQPINSWTYIKNVQKS